jgi:ribosomal protein S28E/S33
MLRVVVLAVALLAVGAGGARAHDADRVFIYVSKTGAGSGRVVSDPPGIDCGQGCLAVFPGNWETNYQPVTLRATADPGSTFAGWSAPCSGTGDCVLELDDAKAVTAHFDGPPRPRSTLTVRTEGPGTVTSNPAAISCGAVCSASFDSGQTVSLVALPDEKARFVGWGGDCTGTAPSCFVGIDTSRSVSARFELIPDTAPPVVSALASTGRRGEVARLRFRVADDSGRSRRVATVYRGARRIGSVASALAREDPAALYYFLGWRVPRTLAPGQLRFCVRAFDAAGNAGGPSCSSLRVR